MKMQEIIDTIVSGGKVIYQRADKTYEVQEKILPSGKRFYACINRSNEDDYASILFMFENQQYLENTNNDRYQSINDIDIKAFREEL